VNRSGARASSEHALDKERITFMATFLAEGPQDTLVSKREINSSFGARLNVLFLTNAAIFATEGNMTKAYQELAIDG
jgi:hypothetical protein